MLITYTYGEHKGEAGKRPAKWFPTLGEFLAMASYAPESSWRDLAALWLANTPPVQPIEIELV